MESQVAGLLLELPSAPRWTAAMGRSTPGPGELGGHHQLPACRQHPVDVYLCRQRRPTGQQLAAALLVRSRPTTSSSAVGEIVPKQYRANNKVEGRNRAPARGRGQ